MRLTPPGPLLPLDLVSRGQHGLAPLLARVLVLNQIIALPVALAMASVNGAFLVDLAIASLYSQTIGVLCVLVSAVTFQRLDALPARRRFVAVAVQYFVTGVIGAEIARRAATAVFPRSEGSGVIASAAVGATVALFVGVILLTVRQLRARVVSTEFEALQARINPHFLFNTLNSIAALIREDPVRAEAVTLRLSALFRYTLQAPRQGLVSLEDELTIVEGYLEIEQERLAERLAYEIDVEPSLLSLRVPALVLQPLVENAIRHGVADAVGGGTVCVRGWREADRIYFTVTNTGDGAGAPGGTGEGLDSVRRRLRASFGPDAAVTLTSSHGATEARIEFQGQR